MPDLAVNQLGHSGFFWSEAAFHYRTTLMYAVDGYMDPSILKQDTWQQHPDGVDAFAEYSLLMEPFLGLLYRWFSGGTLPLIQFLMIVLPLFHVLLLFPVFYLAKTMSGDHRFALVSVAVFSTCSLAFSPLLSSLYVKETFSWVLFAAFLVGHFSYLRSGQARWLGFGASGLLLFLISWHLAQFLTIPVMLMGALCQVCCQKTSAGQPTIRLGFGKMRMNVPVPLAQPLLYWLVFLVAGCVPWLWVRGFIFSTPSAMVLLWLVLALFSQTRSYRRLSQKTTPLMFLLLVSAIAVVVILFTSRIGEDYSHVGGLLWSRIVHGFQKPMDPNELPFAVRVFWVAPYSSPRWLALKAGLGFNGVLLVVATIWSLVRSFRNEKSSLEKAFFGCGALFFVAFIFVERLAPLFILFGSVAVAYLGLHLEKLCKGSAIRNFILPVFLILPAVNLFYSMGGMVQISLATLKGESSRFNHLDKSWDSGRAQMFQWIREETSQSASFVGEIGVSTQLLLYAGRPIVLNSQFENQKIRSRYSEYLSALYSENEADLFSFLKKYQVDYVFINRDWAISQGRNTPKYLAGKTGPNSLQWNISRLHFSPLSMENLEPVFENSFYRVFAFKESGSKAEGTSWTPTYSKWWNLKNFSSEEMSLLDLVQHHVALQNLDLMFQRIPRQLGQKAKAIESFRNLKDSQAVPRESLLSLQKRLALARFELIVEGHSNSLLKKSKTLELTVNERLAEVNPTTGKTVREDFLDLLNGTPEVGPGVLKSILPVECSPEEYSTVGHLLVLLGEFGPAGEFFGRGGAVFPKPALTQDEMGLRPSEFQEQLWENTVLYLMAGGERSKGRNLARFCATHGAPGSPRQQFFLKAGNIQIIK